VDVQAVLDPLDWLTPRRPFTLVGIGGRGGAGKSTLARLLPADAVIGTDEFWNGSSFDLNRLGREVVEPLTAGRSAAFRSFDWAAQAPRTEPRRVAPEGLIVIEGVCALHRMFRDAYDLRVWIEAPYEIRLARGVARDGEEARRTWTDVWMPSEDAYVERDDPVSAADVVLDGGGELP
jgi:uridine kinase